MKTLRLILVMLIAAFTTSSWAAPSHVANSIEGFVYGIIDSHGLRPCDQVVVASIAAMLVAPQDFPELGLDIENNESVDMPSVDPRRDPLL